MTTDTTIALPPPIERLLAELAANRDLSDVADQFRRAFEALERETFSNWHAEQCMLALAWVSEQPRPLRDRLIDIAEIVQARGVVSVTIRRAS
jgi:hypothetical protein